MVTVLREHNTQHTRAQKNLTQVFSLNSMLSALKQLLHPFHSSPFEHHHQSSSTSSYHQHNKHFIIYRSNITKLTAISLSVAPNPSIRPNEPTNSAEYWNATNSTNKNLIPISATKKLNCCERSMTWLGWDYHWWWWLNGVHHKFFVHCLNECPDWQFKTTVLKLLKLKNYWMHVHIWQCLWSG